MNVPFQAIQIENVFELYVDIDLFDLEQRFPNIDWVYMLPYQQTFAGTPVRLVQPSYFERLDQLFNETHEDIIAMHIYARVVLTSLMPYTPLAIRKSMDGIYGNDTSAPFSSGHCLDSTLTLLNDEIHHEYRIKYKDEIESKEAYYTDLSTKIKETLRNYFTSSSEFSEVTSEGIRAKLSELDVQFPVTPLISRTVSLASSADISFLYRANSAIQLKTYQELDTLGTPITRPKIAWDQTSVRLDPDLNVLGININIVLFCSEIGF